MKKNPKISVLIPTYNYAHYLDETIQSVLAQTFQDFECVIVDNASTDNTAEVVAKYLSDERFSYYRNPSNLGLVGNWNQCLVYAKGEYIKYLCADDRFAPTMLEKYNEVMDKHPNVSLVTCDKQLFDGQKWYVELPLKGLQPGEKVIMHTLNTKSWIGEPTSVMFRSSNLSLGNFRADYTLHVDWEMWMRHLTVGDCYIIPEPLAFVRAHAAQHTRKVIHQASFEEYGMSKLLNSYAGLDKRVPHADIRTIVKKKAAVVAKQGVYKELPNILKKPNRAVFFKAAKIAFRERTLTDGLMLLLHGAKTKMLKA